MSIQGSEEGESATDIRFETLFAHAPFSVQLLAADGRTLRVNRAWEALWQGSEGDALKRYVLTEYNMLADPQLEASGATRLLRRAFDGESVTLPTIAYDPVKLGKPGRARWVKATAHPIRDADGPVREVILIHEDVTERLQSDEALRSSELRLKQLADTIPQLAWMADASGWVHWYNDRWYDYTGTAIEDMQGWGWRQVHDPRQLAEVTARWQASLESGEPFRMTVPLRGKDGRFRPFFTLAAPLKDAAGRVVQWFGTNTDVSALQEADENLRATEARLRLATRAGGIGIWEWDVAPDRVTWSEQVYALHGLEAGAFGGRAEDFAALVHPDDRDAVWRKIATAIAHDDGFSAEFRAVLPDGRERWLATWATVHRTPSGEAARLVGATISVDAYKRAEAALRAADRRKDDFLAMLAHELRNPLAPIGAAAQLLQLGLANPAQVRQASEIINRQVRHVTELVDDLVDVSRVTRGLIDVERQVLDAVSVVQGALEQARPLIEARGHAISVEIGPHAVRLLGDRTRLIQALVNVLGNAAKYSPDGGRIALRLASDARTVRITIEDNGKGIDPALLPHLFELFTQGVRTPDRSLGGLGIGLALVKRIVELHGGEVEARSDGPGRGSAFTLTLPRLTDGGAAPPADVARAASPRSPGGLRTLVVDDNRDAAESLAALLSSMGYRVDVRFDAGGALAAPWLSEVDVFILDIGLPDIDGYALVERLRERNARALCIALTGYGQAEDRIRSKAAGFDHHLVKPVDWGELAPLLGGR